MAMQRQPRLSRFERLEARLTMDAGRFAVLSNAIGPTVTDHYDQVVSGDFNSDGRDDLFMIDHNTGNNRLVFCRANREFSVVLNRISNTSADDYTQVVAGDFNGDGRDDLFFLERDSGVNRFAFANSNEGFAISTNLIKPSNVDDYTNWAVGDIDGNGRDDLFMVVVPTGANRIVFTLENQKFSVKTDLIGRTNVDDYWGGMVLDDFDADGRDDIFLRSTFGTNRLVYARSGQKFSFVTNPIDPARAGGGEMVAFDFDATGRADIFISAFDNLLAKMTSGHEFSLSTNRLDRDKDEGKMVAGDFDGDGRGDLFFEEGGSNRFAYSRKSFDIEVVFRSSYTQQQQAMIKAAAARWSQIVIGDLPNVSDDEYDEIDDLLVEVVTAGIDGNLNTLADTQMLFARGNDLPAIARIRIDSADLSSLTSGNDLTGLMIHEMGHALGFGEDTWLSMGLLANSTGPFTVFTGMNAKREYQAVFGNDAGTNVAVENEGGSGAINHHWRENVMQNEIMTSQYSLGVLNPISRITVGALDDMGYLVDYSATDLYSG
jgi:hypothetical protein